MITIIGGGKFGQVISKLLGTNKHHVVDVEPDGTYSAESVENIKQATMIILCVPSSALEDCTNMISGIIKPDAKILNCVKGLYAGLKTPTELIKQTLNNPLATLMGPNLSVEIMDDKPAMAAIAGDHAGDWIGLFKSPRFSPVLEKDVIGVEFGGAIKNIAALGAGLLDGYYEQNTCNSMGSMVAFTVKDIQHLYQHKSNSPIPQLSFIGDLFATCMSETSRNHKYGHEFGAARRENKKTPNPQETVEGYRTLQIVHEYAQQHKITLPAITALYNVFFNNANVEDTIASWR